MKKIYQKTKINKSKKIQKNKRTLKNTKRTLTNKKVKKINILYGGSAGIPINTKPRIVISSRGKFEDIVPIVMYLKWYTYIDTIYANGTPPINTPKTKYIKASNKPANINNEITSMNSSPFVIYIDDDNEVIGEKSSFTTYISKYINNDINTSKTNLLEININTLQLDINKDYNCMFITFPKDKDGLTNSSYYDKIKTYLYEIKQKYKNNILIVFDFDCTLTTKHLYHSLYTSKYEYYNINNKNEFNTAFINPGNDIILKQNEIDKYFGDSTNTNSAQNITKIEDLFNFKKKDTIPELSTSFCNKIKNL